MNFDKVQDSGARQEFETGSKRDTRDGKGRYDLIPGFALRHVASDDFTGLPPSAIFRLARHYENGAKKYGCRNWERGQPLTRYLDSGIRHMFKVSENLMDEDHAAAAVWNMIAFVETRHRIDLGLLDPSLNDMPPSVIAQNERNCKSLNSRGKCIDPKRYIHLAIAHAFMALEGLEDEDHAATAAYFMLQYMPSQALTNPATDDSKLPAKEKQNA
jgi:hypothetical protein